MALTVNTNTYISLVDARAYCTAMGISALPEDDAEAEAVLVRAQKMLDRKYGNRYIGTKSTLQQALLWPRDVGQAGTYRGAGETLLTSTDSDGNPRDFSTTPVECGEAQTELAVLMLDEIDPLAQLPGLVTKYSVSVDTLSDSREFKSSWREDPLSRVTTILRPLLLCRSGISATRGA